MHYTGWSTKYDDWIPTSSERIINQCMLYRERSILKLKNVGQKDMEFQLNNRIDILDEKQNWLEARVIEVIFL